MIGTTIGNYQVVERVGAGGMGEVFRAEHPRIGRKVAIKVLRSEFVANHDLVARFLNEARAAHQIRHPNVVDVLDFGELASGVPYMVMEWLEGRSLLELVHKNEPVPLPRALNIVQQILGAVGAAHARGVIHRDLKPDNVILVHYDDEVDFVKVLDFGIAKLLSVPRGAPGTTQTPTVMGTPEYMSPEQCRGVLEIDGRSDLYSIGVLLFELVTGKLPFNKELMGDFLIAHIQEPPPPPRSLVPHIPPAVEAVILRAMAKAPDDRFLTANAFRFALEAAIGEPAAATQVPSGFSQPAKPPQPAPGQRRLRDLDVPSPIAARPAVAPARVAPLSPPTSVPVNLRDLDAPSPAVAQSASAPARLAPPSQPAPAARSNRSSAPRSSPLAPAAAPRSAPHAPAAAPRAVAHTPAHVPRAVAHTPAHVPRVLAHTPAHVPAQTAPRSVSPPVAAKVERRASPPAIEPPSAPYSGSSARPARSTGPGKLELEPMPTYRLEQVERKQPLKLPIRQALWGVAIVAAIGGAISLRRHGIPESGPLRTAALKLGVDPSRYHITVESTPPGASVYVAGDSVSTCSTPCQVEVPPGPDVLLQLRMSGYVEEIRTVPAKDDTVVRVDLTSLSAPKKK